MRHQYSGKLFQILVLLFISSILISCEPSVDKATNTESTEAVENEEAVLASWEDGPKQQIISWVNASTTDGSSDFIPAADRIAVFDNDGTLWSEQPAYFQVLFAIDEIKRMSPEHPEWKDNASINALLNGDMAGFMAGGEKAVMELLATTHTNMTQEEFEQHVSNWIRTAKHPKSGKLYSEMVFQPMLELLDYLRANEFKTFIVSGGGIDFMRVWVEEAYGIPPYQVVGSLSGLKYEMEGDSPVLMKTPELFFVDDKTGKPIGIARAIGKRPVFAAGNSDGDYEMLQYTSTGDGARFGMYIHHTDSVREVAYDRESHIGKLSKGLDDAAKYNWLVVDMAKDWKVIYPSDLK